jgi:hypothetical protein
LFGGIHDAAFSLIGRKSAAIFAAVTCEMGLYNFGELKRKPQIGHFSMVIILQKCNYSSYNI